ncbi:putative inhibitor of apoptosis isoform X2 [Antedon mediterranea]|uniref:putative inhibitor of apoptosis isoform X2 n=1 Tax=Antedon mediterranea TaxID=105859 RepID=UPI003AF74C27
MSCVVYFIKFILEVNMSHRQNKHDDLTRQKSKQKPTYNGRGSGEDQCDGGDINDSCELSSDVETDSTSTEPPDMSSYFTRLASFKNWPITDIISATSLAKSGLFYLGCRDIVKCYSCGGQIRDWEVGDAADAEHRRHYPQCQLLKQSDETNSEKVVRAAKVNSNQYFNPIKKQQLHQNLVKQPQRQTARILDTNTLIRHGSNQRQPPLTRTLFPQYSSADRREETFKRWQTYQQPYVIAEAGFFALEDSPTDTKCFYCGGGLRSWGINDDPWVEHAKWFPKCEWLIQKKGKHFIQKVQRDFPNLKMPLSDQSQQKQRNQQKPSQQRNQQKPSQHTSKKQTTLQDAMHSKYVLQILEMGYDIKQVEKVVQRRLKSTGDNFNSAAELFDAVMMAENDESSFKSDSMSCSKVDSLKGDSQNCKDDSLQANGKSKHQALELPKNDDSTTSRQGRRSTSSESDEENLSEELKSTLRDLREKGTCKICMDNEACVLFVPCSHLATCVSCAENLSSCPICRTTIQRYVKAYLA